jgi:hypothetical protein
MNFKVGDFVYLNEQSGIGVVLGLEPDEDSSEYDHLKIWFGTFENGHPEIWLVPAAYCQSAPEPVLKH